METLFIILLYSTNMDNEKNKLHVDETIENVSTGKYPCLPPYIVINYCQMIREQRIRTTHTTHQ